MQTINLWRVLLIGFLLTTTISTITQAQDNEDVSLPVQFNPLAIIARSYEDYLLMKKWLFKWKPIFALSS